jgi:alanine racemase
MLGAKTWLCVAIKANAYGFGLVEVGARALAAGADAVAVSDLSDAIRLRENGISAPILLYPGNLPEQEVVTEVERLGLWPTIVDIESARAWSTQARDHLKVFAKVDVGLERLGIPVNEALGVIQQITTLPRLSLHGVYTHLHVTDANEALAYARWQFARFERLLADLKRAGVDIPFRMAAASAALRISRDMKINAVDPGHLIYGLLPPGPGLVQLDLRPAFAALRTHVIQVKYVRDRDFTDQLPFRLREAMRVGVLPIGRRDGMASFHCGQVLAGGRRVDILGSVSLEHTRIDLTDVPGVVPGDEVVIIGQQENETISTQQVIDHQNMESPVALALEIRDTVRRIYFELPSLRTRGGDTRLRNNERSPSRPVGSGSRTRKRGEA